MEPIEILHWYTKLGARNPIGDKVIQFSPRSKDVCGTCMLTVDKARTNTADAILISNGPFIQWLKVLLFN